MTPNLICLLLLLGLRRNDHITLAFYSALIVSVQTVTQCVRLCYRDFSNLFSFAIVKERPPRDSYTCNVGLNNFILFYIYTVYISIYIHSNLIHKMETTNLI
jgi:hypothetical protein